MSATESTPSDKAFQEFCRDPKVAAALKQARSLPIAIVYAAFMAGAQHAVARCEAAGHGKRTP